METSVDVLGSRLRLQHISSRSFLTVFLDAMLAVIALAGQLVASISELGEVVLKVASPITKYNRRVLGMLKT